MDRANFGDGGLVPLRLFISRRLRIEPVRTRTSQGASGRGYASMIRKLIFYARMKISPSQNNRKDKKWHSDCDYNERGFSGHATGSRIGQSLASKAEDDEIDLDQLLR